MRRKGKARRVAPAPAVVLDAGTIRDDVLVEQAVDIAAPESGEDPSTLLIACGALAREILAVIEVNGLTGLSLECLPAILHNHPDRITEAVRAKIRRARGRGVRDIFVVYADCGTGGHLDAMCAEEGVERIAGPHCYAFFDGLEEFASRSDEEIGAFYLTDFLARQFDTLIWKGMGMAEHPELRDMYFAHYDRVVHLAQTDDPALDAKARAAADRLGLAYVRRKTGYGALPGFLTKAASAAP